MIPREGDGELNAGNSMIKATVPKFEYPSLSFWFEIRMFNFSLDYFEHIPCPLSRIAKYLLVNAMLIQPFLHVI